MGICGCLTSQLAGCILYLINSVFMLIGVAIAALGCVLHFGGNGVYKLFSDALGSIVNTNIGIGGDTIKVGITDLQKILGSWSSIISYAGLILLGLGLFFVAIGILGCIGACCKLKILLIVYAVLMLAITLTLIGFCIGYLVVRNDMNDLVAREMKKLIYSQYQGGAASENDFTKIFDIIQGKLECCGVSNYTEFHSAPQWNRTYYHKESGRFVNLTAPIPCCKLRMENMEPMDKNCALNQTESNSNLHIGCNDKLWNFMDSFANALVIGIAITAAVTGGISILAIIMLCYHFANDITPI